MKNSKQFVILSLALTTFLAGSANVFANENSSNEDRIIIGNSGELPKLVIPPIIDGGGKYEPKIEVLPNQKRSLPNGEAHISFNYTSYADARVYLKNTSKKPIKVEITFPGGQRNLMRATLEPDQQLQHTFPLYDVYGGISHGLWDIFVYTQDGSSGSVIAAVRTLD